MLPTRRSSCPECCLKDRSLARKDGLNRRQVAEIIGGYLVDVHENAVTRFKSSNQGGQIKRVQYALIEKVLGPREILAWADFVEY